MGIVECSCGDNRQVKFFFKQSARQNRQDQSWSNVSSTRRNVEILSSSQASAII